jgi:hypothetical protein
VEKSSTEIRATFVFFIKQPKENNRPKGENSTNLVTLATWKVGRFYVHWKIGFLFKCLRKKQFENENIAEQQTQFSSNLGNNQQSPKRRKFDQSGHPGYMESRTFLCPLEKRLSL